MNTQVAVVTGASSGIGLEVARLLLKRGVSVAMIARDASRLHRAAADLGKGSEGPRALAIVADVGDPSQCRSALSEALREFGRIDYLVNNAAMVRSTTLEGADPESIEDIFRVNAVGPTVLTHAVWRSLLHAGETNTRPGPAIVNISSMATADPYPGLGLYAVTKSAVEMLTRVTAQEGSASGHGGAGGAGGIRAYCVAPGAVETPMLRSLFDAESLPTSKTLPPEHVAFVIVNLLLGESQQPSGALVRVPSP